MLKKILIALALAPVAAKADTLLPQYDFAAVCGQYTQATALQRKTCVDAEQAALDVAQQLWLQADDSVRRQCSIDYRGLGQKTGTYYQLVEQCLRDNYQP